MTGPSFLEAIPFAASGSSRGTLASVGQKLGINPETLRNWAEKAEIDSGQRPGITSDDKKRVAELDVGGPGVHLVAGAAGDRARAAVAGTPAV
jgi:hypothetical protein